MEVDPDQRPTLPSQAPCVITIGNFDGVHLGHQSIIARARAIAAERGLPVRAMAFDPSPLSVLRPGSEPLRLVGPDRKVALLKAAGADEVILIQPTRELLNQTAEEFVHRLVAEHKPAAVVEGPDFGFGKGRRGDVALLGRMGAELGFAVQVVEPVTVGLYDQLLVPVRSSLVRWLLAHGRVADAVLCLNRPFELAAPVVAGERRGGRELGIPTANLDAAALTGWVVPEDGVYSGRVVLPSGVAHPAAISIGVKPTFAGQSRVVEAHLLDFQGDLYGQTISVHFIRWLRDQQVFPGIAALRAQLGRDIEQTRRWDRLAERGKQSRTAVVTQ